MTFRAGPAPIKRREPRWPPADLSALPGLDPARPPRFTSTRRWQAEFAFTLLQEDYARVSPVFNEALRSDVSISVATILEVATDAQSLGGVIVLEAPTEPIARFRARAAALRAITAAPRGITDPFAGEQKLHVRVLGFRQAA